MSYFSLVLLYNYYTARNMEKEVMFLNGHFSLSVMRFVPLG